MNAKPNAACAEYAGYHGFPNNGGQFEVFWPSKHVVGEWIAKAEDAHCYHEASQITEGWYWWPCRPGCMPDGEPPFGPYNTSAEAWRAGQTFWTAWNSGGTGV